MFKNNKLFLKFMLLVLLTYIILYIIYYTCVENFTQINENDASLTDINIETNKVDSLVVLFSTQYRTWEKCCENQIDLMKHISTDINNCIIGIHYWNDVNIPPPTKMQELNIKYSTSDNFIFLNNESYIQQWFKRFQYSTKFALDNAEQLYIEKFGKQMPDEQPILRLRPDFVVENIQNFPLPPINEDNYYISTWNTIHRPVAEVNKIEIVDIFITNKKTLFKILNFDINTIKLAENKIIEQVFYDMLNILKVNIFFDFNIKHGIMRSDNIEWLTK